MCNIIQFINADMALIAATRTTQAPSDQLPIIAFHAWTTAGTGA